MLYLGGGIRQVNVGNGQAISVLPDFSDPTQFYYLPNYPHIAMLEGNLPAIRLLVYRENLDEIDDADPEAVGFLSLDVDLSWPPDLIDRAASKLMVDGTLDRKPRLTPIFFSAGSVKLMLLDAVTPDAGAPPPAGTQPSQFVTQIMGAGSPSLYGDNRAIFQATLSKKGAAALAGALDGVTPIGVVYSLTFAGLQPAFRVRAKVNWQKVYDHFSESEKLDLLFYESDIQKSIDKLRDERVIEFDVTVEGIGAAAMDAEREAAMTAIRQLIFDKFFEATLKPADPAGGGTANDIVDTIAELAKNSVTLGVGYSYSRKEVTIEELRSLDIDWTARKAVERTIYPQAHLSNLIKNSGITREQLITVVTPDDIYRTLPFQIASAAAWEADGIAAISVDVEYTSPSGATRSISVFLDKNKSSVVRRDWMDRTSGSTFRYKYEVVFQDGVVPGPKPKLSSPWIERTGTALVINPSELFESVELEVGAVPDFAFPRWPAVQAILRYRADDGSFEHYADGVLTSANKSFKTRFRTEKHVPGRREVQLTYIGATGERVATPWMPMPQDQWVVDDPHPNKLVIRVVVAGERQNVANLLVDIDYEDQVAGINESGLLAFDSENINQALSWTVNLADPTKRRYPLPDDARDQGG